ncbi:MAG: FAD-dependent monooxygenase [Pseudomonadota bacterium]
MTEKFTDIFISGGGVAGLSAAVAFGAAGFDVVCVDPVPPVTNRAADGADLRTTAYLQPSQAFLDRIGLWAHVQDTAQALNVMRIVDADHGTPKDFASDDISDAPFGWNVGNWHMRAALLARLADLPNVDFRPGLATTDYFTRTDRITATLSDGNKISAALGLAADGRDSFIRTALAIPAKRTDFGQTALTFAVTHPVPHKNVSTEVHKSGGPFTLVPLPDHDGQPCSAVVWMETAANARTLLGLEDDTFNTAATQRSAHVNGPLTLASRRTAWPIISQIAERLAGERTALVAEAAHVVPPIGAQGLNMSLKDIEVLLDLSIANRATLGSAEMLQAYHRARFVHIKLRVTGIGLLNRTSMAGATPLRKARALGLDAIHGIAPLRKTLMRLGLGAT